MKKFWFNPLCIMAVVFYLPCVHPMGKGTLPVTKLTVQSASIDQPDCVGTPPLQAFSIVAQDTDQTIIRCPDNKSVEGLRRVLAQKFQAPTQSSAETTTPCTAVQEAFNQPPLLSHLASFLPPKDFFRFAQVNRACSSGCKKEYNTALFYNKTALFLIENFSNPIHHVLKHTDESGITTINETQFDAGQLIDTLQSLGAQICRIANHRRSIKMQTKAQLIDARLYNWEPPYLKPIPSRCPNTQNDIEHGLWIYLSNSTELTSPDAQSDDVAMTGDENDTHISENIIESIRRVCIKKHPAGIALDLTKHPEIITQELLEALSQFPIVSLCLTDCRFSHDVNFRILAKFTELRELFIGGKDSPNITTDELKALCSLKHLQALVLRNADITQISFEESQLRKLRYLNLQDNPITSIDNIVTLDNLRILILTSSHPSEPLLESIPNSIKHLKNLRVLLVNNCDVSIGNLRTISPEINNLTHLKILDVSGNQVEKLPETMCTMHSLKELYINATNILLLPSAIAHLPRLSKVNIFRSNSDMKIPTSILRILASSRLKDEEFSKQENITILCDLLDKKEALKKIRLQKDRYLAVDKKCQPIFDALDGLFSEFIAIKDVKLLLKNLYHLSHQTTEAASKLASVKALQDSSWSEDTLTPHWKSCLKTEIDLVKSTIRLDNLWDAIIKELTKQLHIVWNIDASEKANPEIINILVTCLSNMQYLYNEISLGHVIKTAQIQELENVMAGEIYPQSYIVTDSDKHVMQLFLNLCLLKAIERNDKNQADVIIKYNPQAASRILPTDVTITDCISTLALS